MSEDPFLRPWRADDAGALLAAVAGADDLASQFGGAVPATLDEAAAHLERSLVFTERARNWAVELDGVAVGNVGLSAIERTHDTAWAYYWLAPAARGRGLASRGLAAAAEWAFSEGLFRLELGHRVNNSASCSVATAAGFAAEGIERAKLRYGAERFDVEAHARLATDPLPAVVPLPLRLA
jgi:RimJ/RimL family protein N-acetyltransferase